MNTDDSSLFISLLTESGQLNLLESLSRVNIKTVDALLKEMNSSSPAIPQNVLEMLERCVIDRLAATGVTAYDELELAAKNNRPCIQTGIQSLDEMLRDSGCSTHTLAEISGLPGSGKTVCLLNFEQKYSILNG